MHRILKSLDGVEHFIEFLDAGNSRDGDFGIERIDDIDLSQICSFRGRADNKKTAGLGT